MIGAISRIPEIFSLKSFMEWGVYSKPKILASWTFNFYDSEHRIAEVLYSIIKARKHKND